jgi:hypothetical protein
MNVAQARLRDALKDLRLRLEHTRPQWDDDARAAFERDVIDPLDQRVQAAMGAIARVTEACAAARRGCEAGGA